MPIAVALPVQARDTNDELVIVSDSEASSGRDVSPTRFRWRYRLSVLGRVPNRVPVPGDGNCMLHAWVVTSCQSTHVDELRNRICDTMHATAPSSAWMRDELNELQGPEDVQWEASE